MWREKAKECWLMEGDANTHYFHIFIISLIVLISVYMIRMISARILWIFILICSKVEHIVFLVIFRDSFPHQLKLI